MSKSNPTESEQAIKDMTNRKNWLLAICNGEWAAPSIDGKTVTCDVCVGTKSSRTDGVITMKHAYKSREYDEH
eukprot:5817200-Ditylum_brightwellii.AAC.1